MISEGIESEPKLIGDLFEIQIPSLSELKRGNYEILPPQEEIKYPLIYYVPENLDVSKPVTVVFWGHGSQKHTDLIEQANAIVHGGVPREMREIWEKTNCVVVTPVLPRKNAFDAQILGRGTVLPEDDTPKEFIGPDIEIIKMLAQMQKSLSDLGYKVEPKIISAGISAGANAANRFAVIYPDLIKGVALLSAGDFSLPTSHMGDLQLNYPFGTADLSEIVKGGFKGEVFSAIPHFVYVGEQDTHENKDPFWYEIDSIGVPKDEANKLRIALGGNQVGRAHEYVKSLQKQGVPVSFYSNPNAGHKPTHEDFENLGDFIAGLCINKSAS